MKIIHLLAIAVIFAATSVAWFILGSAMDLRTHEHHDKSGERIADGWGPPLVQTHPTAWHASPGTSDGRRPLAIAASDIAVNLSFEPRRRGLINHRTYAVDFRATYQIENSTPVSQTVYVSFTLPDASASYENFSFALGNGGESRRSPRNGVMTEAIVLPAGGSAALIVTYLARGVDAWRYHFNDNTRVSDFRLMMQTNFREIDFPVGTGSPTERSETDQGWQFTWAYPDVIAAPGIGMSMPDVLNAGPITSRIAFFAPISLLFFFTVLVLTGIERGTNLHPMNYFFLSAAFFAFHILLAYLVDVMPLHAAFAIAAVVSLALVGGYIRIVSKGALTVMAIAAQAVYLVLFSYTFFIPGLTGLAITLGAVATLAILMFRSARIDWTSRFTPPRQTPPPLKV
ncbi:MAG: inner membrane CreD family protein [Luteolibacter sp.]